MQFYSDLKARMAEDKAIISHFQCSCSKLLNHINDDVVRVDAYLPPPMAPTQYVS